MEPRIKDCPLARTVQQIGEWWTLELLHEAFDGYSLFDDFQKNLKLSTDTLANRLDSVIAKGLMQRRPHPENLSRYEYVLTDLGRSLRPIILAMAAWGNHRLAPRERSLILVDAVTGEEADPVVVDRATGRRADTADYVFTAGPAASEPLRDRYGRKPVYN